VAARSCLTHPLHVSARVRSKHSTVLLIPNDCTYSFTDRLPTVSASTALHKLRDAAPHAISTGLPRLDVILSGQRAVNSSSGTTASRAASRGKGGLVRGQITEVYGPPGVGKTAFWYVGRMEKTLGSC
jgi:hypothetical protein